MFRTNNIEIVRNCQSYLGFNLPSDLWPNRVKRFDVKYMPPPGAVLLNMVSLSLSLLMFWCFSCSGPNCYRFLFLSCAINSLSL